MMQPELDRAREMRREADELLAEASRLLEVASTMDDPEKVSALNDTARHLIERSERLLQRSKDTARKIHEKY